ncbi:hemoglobin subunit beta-1-like [Hypomesus transpacificus]|uniref:hemoglobin subunit beta-1-like n=1 Tax=Hypomesus transpacificus TaxID=137520 RepID=UPI001F0810F8|nr:hemoglobin subunit beta-1-like [Hypomesus transpacificus]
MLENFYYYSYSRDQSSGNMGKWSSEELACITGIFAKMDYEDVGPKALQRCLIVYPWTQRYFATFGNLYNAEAIIGNAKVAAHGIKVLHGLDIALKNMDDIKGAYASLSVMHSEKLHVDPDNFRLLGDCLTVVIAAKMGPAFTATVQGHWQKFLQSVVSALCRQYH